MAFPVIAIGLDAADPFLLRRWMDEGHLPQLKKLADNGIFANVYSGKHNISETSWTTFFTGCWPEKTGFWSQLEFDQDLYACRTITYDYRRFPPFYAVGREFQVALFDLPQAAITDNLEGIQVLAWGTHSAQTPSISKPSTLLDELKSSFGPHPALNKDNARIWRKGSLERLQDRLQRGIDLRTEICIDLLGRKNWDLFFTIFAETHSAGHYFYHLSQRDHPLYEYFKGILGPEDPLLDIYKKTDLAIGKILEAAPKESHVIVFSQEGTVANNLDLTGMYFLPEILFRYSFENQTGFGNIENTSNLPPPPMILKPRSLGWVREVWSTKTDENPLRRFVRKHFLMELSHLIDQGLGGVPGAQYPYNFRPHFQPSLWFSPLWKQMRAFALPTYCDGYIRINLCGRERNGIVEPNDYQAICDDLRDHIYQLKDPRTQKSIVREVIQTRSERCPSNLSGLDPDLIVIWDSDVPCDIVDSPTFGRIGPIPHRRSGGHSNNGFLIAKGPTIRPGSDLSCNIVDLAPSILALMEAPIPSHMDGQSILS